MRRATALLRVQSERRVQRVNLYLALGGDFGVDAALGAEREPMTARVVRCDRQFAPMAW